MGQPRLNLCCAPAFPLQPWHGSRNRATAAHIRKPAPAGHPCPQTLQAPGPATDKQAALTSPNSPESNLHRTRLAFAWPQARPHNRFHQLTPGQGRRGSTCQAEHHELDDVQGGGVDHGRPGPAPSTPPPAVTPAASASRSLLSLPPSPGAALGRCARPRPGPAQPA